MSSLASRPTRWLRATLRAATKPAAPLTALVLLAPATLARAEPATTTQAQADDGTFLDYTPPPATHTGLCLIDTGVNTNPDTQNTVVLRTAIDGGTGEDLSPTTHGTILAMLAAAPTNNWGTLGTAPNTIQIVSVRILEPKQTTFPFNSYAAAISICLQLHKRYNIRVINLSLGSSETPSSGNYETVGDAIEEATDYGVAVVAAAGNDGGGPVGYPAAYPGVLSVDASDTQGGGFCSFSSRGARLLAPGCDLQAADPTTGEEDYDYWQGTSEASVIAAAALDALLAYKPSLSPQAGEEDLTDAEHRVLNIAAAFQDAGLAALVSEGEAAEPRQPQAPSSPAPPSPTAASPAATTEPGMTAADPPQSMTPSIQVPSMTGHLQRPRVQLERRSRRLLLTLKNTTSEAPTEARYFGRHRGHLYLLGVRASYHNRTILLPAAGVAEVELRCIDPYDPERDSPWIKLSVPPARR